MKTLNLQDFAESIIRKRGDMGIRETAKIVGISPSTLSRIERGYLPDLETFKAVCDWLEVNPGDILGTSIATKSESKIPSVHFKKEKTTTEETAKHLANMIIYAQQALELQEQGI